MTASREGDLHETNMPHTILSTAAVSTAILRGTHAGTDPFAKSIPLDRRVSAWIMKPRNDKYNPLQPRA
jgi:hypothetical protein